MKEILKVLEECRSTLVMVSLIDKSNLAKDTLEKVEDLISKLVTGEEIPRYNKMDANKLFEGLPKPKEYGKS